MDRRLFITLALAGLGPTGSVLAQSEPTPADLLGTTGEPYFADWLNGFYQRALQAGVPRALLDHELSGLSSDPRITALDAQQPEFARPVSAYIEGTVNQKRIDIGREKRVSVGQFPAIERTYGVPRDILIGIWAMESNFGVLQGDFDIIRCLATLAASGRRRAWAEGELLASLKIIGDGDAPRSRLRGSWAGAMGQTQFLPSTYLATAVDGDGDGRRDIWGSAPDALASAANLLAKAGWRRGEGWAYEIVLPAGFDYGLSENAREAPEWWRARGVRKAGGAAWSPQDAASSAMLLLPAGAAGPAFLAFPNHFAIRAYNNSIAYALAVGLLADRFAGGGALRTPWPRETPLSLTDRLDTQTALIRLGFNPGPADGAIGLMSRQALRAWQKSQGLPADGYLSPEIVARLRKAM
jgi:membrane-bound lytic murein transglycosylase B